VALELLAAHNLELVAAHARYDAAEAALALEVRRQYPDLGLGLGAGSEGEDDRLLFGLELPLPLWNRNARAIAIALAQRAFERTRYETELARVANEYADARRRLAGAATRRAVVIDELLPLIELQAQDLALLRESGRLDVSALLEALSARADALDTAVTVEVEFARAAADLERLVGPPQHVQSHIER
jgi:cobalt-zinc-cadmium efflux system outer membrane protein